MSLEFACPTCAKIIKLPPRAAGKRGECPYCRAVMVAPALTAGQQATCAAEIDAEVPIQIQTAPSRLGRPGRASRANGPLVQILGLVGAGVLCIGVFCPVATAGIDKSVNFQQTFLLNGFALLGTVLVTLPLALLSQREMLLAIGALSSVLLTYEFTRLLFVFRELERLKANILLGIEPTDALQLVRAIALDSPHLSWGWLLLFAGAFLLIAAGCCGGALIARWGRKRAALIVVGAMLTLLLTTATGTWARLSFARQPVESQELPANDEEWLDEDEN